MPKIREPRKDGAELRPDGILVVPQADGSHEAHHSAKCHGSHKYRFTIDISKDPVTKKRRQRRYTFTRLKDAKAERARLTGAVNDGKFVDRSKDTVSEMLDRYLKWACFEKADNTALSYRTALLPVRERLGNRKTQSLTREDIEALRDWMSAEGRRRGGTPGSGRRPPSCGMEAHAVRAAARRGVRAAVGGHRPRSGTVTIGRARVLVNARGHRQGAEERPRLPDAAAR
jgi:hypothetical protein